MNNIEIKKFFDDDALKFADERWNYSPEGHYDYQNTFLWISKFFPEKSDWSCLDLGCGSGHWITSLDSNGCKEYTGIDISYNMLKQSISTFTKIEHDLNMGIPMDKFVENKKFDLIIAIHSFEYIENITNLLNDCSKLLKNDGYILIITKNKYAYIWRLFKFIADFLKGKSLFQFWRNEYHFQNKKLEIQNLSGIDCRIPFLFNNVNDRFKMNIKYKSIRNFILSISKFIFKLYPYHKNPFCWHIGIAMKIKS